MQGQEKTSLSWFASAPEQHDATVYLLILYTDGISNDAGVFVAGSPPDGCRGRLVTDGYLDWLRYPDPTPGAAWWLYTEDVVLGVPALHRCLV